MNISIVNAKVATEFHHIMQSTGTISSEQPCSSRGISCKVTLHTRSRKKKGRKNYNTEPTEKLQTFQKKLVVLKYMGWQAPLMFKHHEDDILFRGLLPEIALTASEAEVRNLIVSVLHNNKSFQLQTLSQDFEFINAHGKQLSIPTTCGEDYEFNGNAVKYLAGVGAIYIRLLKRLPSRPPIVIRNDSDFELPQLKDSRHDCDSDSSFELPALHVPPPSTSLPAPPMPTTQAHRRMQNLISSRAFGCGRKRTSY